MTSHRSSHRYLTLLLLSILPLGATAQQSFDAGPYVVHYNAVITAFLPADTLRHYHVRRSRTRALLTVSVLKKEPGSIGRAVTAHIAAHATNMALQLKQYDMREVREGDAIYYLSDFLVTNHEVLDFVLQVQPTGDSHTYKVTFRKEFFTD